MEGLMRSLFFFGAEPVLHDLLHRYKWDFSNVEIAFEEGGFLHGKEKVYLIGRSNLTAVEIDGETKPVCIPSIAAVVSPCPPSDHLVISRGPRNNDEVVHMKEMAMEWSPYIPMAYREKKIEMGKPEVFTLKCTDAVKDLRSSKLENYDYCLPYLFRPLEKGLFDTVVPIFYPADSTSACFLFDWVSDDVERYCRTLVSKGEIQEEDKENFKNYLLEKAMEWRKPFMEKEEANQKVYNQISEEARGAYKKTQLYKFYPVQNEDTPDVPIDLRTSKFINSYYGDAHLVL